MKYQGMNHQGTGPQGMKYRRALPTLAPVRTMPPPPTLAPVRTMPHPPALRLP